MFIYTLTFLYLTHTNLFRNNVKRTKILLHCPQFLQYINETNQEFKLIFAIVYFVLNTIAFNKSQCTIYEQTIHFIHSDLQWLKHILMIVADNIDSINENGV